MPAHVLIAGATGGIGRALAGRCAEYSDLQTLVLCARHVQADAEFQAWHEPLAQRAVRFRLIDVDITSESSLAAMTEGLLAEVPALDFVINASGLLHAPGVAPEKMLEQIDAQALQAVFAVNAFGPILLAKALMPWLKARRRIVYASLSARVGSIDDNRLGGWYAYRAAKAAQNQLLKTLAIELKRRNPEAIVLALHPGTTDTRLSTPFQQNVPADKLFSPAFVAERLMAIIEGAQSADSGRFIGWDGRDIRW